MADAFPDAVALGFGEGGGDRQEQLGETVSRDVASKQYQPLCESELSIRKAILGASRLSFSRNTD
jgi:hypothetical protein